MSKATDWAKRLREASSAVGAVEQAQPASFTLHASARDRFYFTVDRDGTPRLQTPEASNGYKPEVKDLLLLAGWLLSTFGDS